MSGGRAINGGIDYQQRISAWFLILLYSGEPIDYTLSEDSLKDVKISSVSFETSNPIDDLKIECQNNSQLLVQIKRSIDFSNSLTSNFGKVIDQFVRQFSRNNSNDHFILITSSKASQKVRITLKKIIESIKLNPLGHRTNPLSKEEKKTYDEIKNISLQLFKKYKIPFNSEQWIKFISKVSILQIDIEENQTFEFAALLYLKSLQFQTPQLIWSFLIKNALNYAKNSQSISFDGIRNSIDRYRRPKVELNNDFISRLLEPNIVQGNPFPVGKEVVLIKSFVENLDYMLCECTRFTEEGTLKHKFKENKMIFGDIEWEIVQRFATVQGATRYLDENPELLKDKRIGLFPANGIENIEFESSSILHRDYLKSILKNNNQLEKCIHCNKIISTEDATTIEVFDEESKPAIGAIHNSCLRPLDRIIGRLKIQRREPSKLLNSLDIRKWLELFLHGQKLMKSLKSNTLDKIAHTQVIGWSSNQEYNVEYNYCVRFILKDNTYYHASDRGKLHRMPKSEASEFVESLKDKIELGQLNNDPFSVIVPSRMSNFSSILLKIIRPGDDIIEIIDASIERYSEQMKIIQQDKGEYYAPLCILTTVEDELYCNISNVIPLISEPQYLNTYLQNWKRIGFDFDDAELRIISSDSKFDYYMRTFIKDGYTPIIDPIFNNKFELMQGFPVQDYDELIREKTEIIDAKK